MFLRGQATLYNVGLWLYSQDMLDFHFIDSNHVAIPVYTRLFFIKSAAKHLASCTSGILTENLRLSARFIEARIWAEEAKVLDTATSFRYEVKEVRFYLNSKIWMKLLWACHASHRPCEMWRVNKN